MGWGAYLDAGKLGRNWCLPETDQHPAPLSPGRKTKFSTQIHWSELDMWVQMSEKKVKSQSLRQEVRVQRSHQWSLLSSDCKSEITGVPVG